MGTCKICNKKVHYFFEQKTVCLVCDELTFDMEIEQEEPKVTRDETSQKIPGIFLGTKSRAPRR